jgi:carbamoyl-phosphate synthase large subunit
VAKVGDGAGRDAVELIGSGEIRLVINSPRGRGPRADGAHIRRAASVHNVPCLTTAAAARAAAAGLADWLANPLTVTCLQEYHQGDQLQLPLS